MACMVYAARFPRLARNQKKQKLSIQALELSIDGDICDSYGDPVYVKESYQVSRTPPAIVRTQQDGTHQAVEPPPNILSKLLTGWLLAALPLRAIASPLRGNGRYIHWRFSGGERIIASLSMLN